MHFVRIRRGERGRDERLDFPLAVGPDITVNPPRGKRIDSAPSVHCGSAAFQQKVALSNPISLSCAVEVVCGTTSSSSRNSESRSTLTRVWSKRIPNSGISLSGARILERQL